MAATATATLFYPGRPAELGGTSDFPVESLRLKLIRDGLEDYEYLRLASEVGEAALARRLAEELAPNPYGWRRNPRAPPGRSPQAGRRHRGQAGRRRF